MKLFYLADGASVHTRKWVNSLLEKGHRIHLFSLNSFDPDIYAGYDELFTYTVYDLTEHKTVFGGLNKLNYFRVVNIVRDLVAGFGPDLVHAHFASSYGMLAAKADVHPMLISVWGYDVFHFPKRSFIHRRMLKKNLSKADKVLSTSHVMAKETGLYTSKPIEVTPFGIDTDKFSPKPKAETPYGLYNKYDFVIGTAKPLEDKYAIDDLIRAFAMLAGRHPEKPLKLAIAGDGAAREKLASLAKELGVGDEVHFLGKIDHSKIPAFYRSLDVFAALSLEESFGVAVIEAGACAKPVVVSDEGGLPEVVEKDRTGFIVGKRDPEAAAASFEELLLHPALCEKMGQAGRERVMRLYDWNRCVEQMLDIYKNTIE